MIVFVDTSAFYALLDADDANQKPAADTLIDLRKSGARLVTSNYVVLESCALLQKRIGMSAISMLRDSLLPLASIRWVDEGLHEEGMDLLLTCGRNGPSFVDCTSFAVMRRNSIRTAFVLDRHFADQGFECLPEFTAG